MVTQKLVNAFHEAALFLRDRIEYGGWKVFSSNYLREHVRCRHGLKFSNTLSPKILDEVLEQHPELAHWIKTNARKATPGKNRNGRATSMDIFENRRK